MDKKKKIQITFNFTTQRTIVDLNFGEYVFKCFSCKYFKKQNWITFISCYEYFLPY